MPTVTIDDRTFDYEGPVKLLQLCLDAGIELPHFCYHPALSIPANCRQCLVQVGTPVIDRETSKPKLDDKGQPVIQFFPKLMTSCSVDVTDGMVVRTHRSNDLVARAQQDNLEFLLINHPLDCPICDQAGMCPLQNQAYKYGPEGSRFEFEKVHKPKRVPLGPRVMLDAERCINCTRCTRFTDEISRSQQLTIIARGDKNYPMTAPGRLFDEPYSMNTIDLCPVGALTSADFRFKARIWELSSTPSISIDCSKGTNVEYWVRDNTVLRITPRQNMAVNEYWMPDAARLVYPMFNENRPYGPAVRAVGGDGAPLAGTSWDEAYEAAAALLRDAGPGGALFLGSAYATVEDNYLLARLAREFGAPAPAYIPHLEPGTADGWLVTDDKTPNAAGCERLGIRPVDAADLRARLRSGEVKLLYVLEDDPIGSGVLTPADLQGVAVVLHHYHTTNQTLPHAAVALPAAMVVETVGTYVNDGGLAQRVRPAKAIRGIHRTLMGEMSKTRADRHGTPFDRWHREENKVNCWPSWEILQHVAERAGASMRYRSPKAIMQEISETVDAFRGATYDAMDLHGYPLAGVGQTA